MNTETILLIVSLFSNAVIILKKIKTVWTPCLIIQCSQSVEDNLSNDSNSGSEGSRALRIKRFITERFTPRRTQTQAVNDVPV